jgi:hypothetical protein
MSQPVKLSDALVLDARIAGEAQERSIAGQVEFWAKLGRSVELLLDGKQVLALCRSVGAVPLAELVGAVDSPGGRDRFRSYLESEPYPHFEAHPTREGLLVRTEENGKRTVGRFQNRLFVPESPTELKASTTAERATAAKGARSITRNSDNAAVKAASRGRGLKSQ